MTFICASGMYLNSTVVVFQSFIFHIASIALSIYLMCYVQNPMNSENSRKYALAALAFQLGFNLGPAIHQIAHFNPEILSKAILYTSTAFTSFTAISLFSKRRSLLFLGGIAFTLFQGMMLYRFLGFLTGFGGAQGLTYLFIMLFIDCCFLIYNTQLMIERAERGTKDVPSDTMHLFLDLLRLFVRILSILLELSSDKKKKK